MKTGIEPLAAAALDYTPPIPPGGMLFPPETPLFVAEPAAPTTAELLAPPVPVLLLDCPEEFIYLS